MGSPSAEAGGLISPSAEHVMPWEADGMRRGGLGVPLTLGQALVGVGVRVAAIDAVSVRGVLE